ncbi:MAG: L,D-transpeptidase [Candidatus Binatus sp.]|uniref:L,D-transpeptidase n=1 Tax=Candidatus Binatus sp. TaxID=2811406 RepID=UPI0027284B50|nr:L,D-transpeptidase [Candidatus Binatus sp.]MDO8434396.1 L,D-transpeptidase [Candidatus Binatus sp.]
MARALYRTIAASLLIALIAKSADAFLWFGSGPTATVTATPTSSPTPTTSSSPTPSRTPTKTPIPKATPAPLAHNVVGGEFDFIAGNHTSFSRIGSRFGIGPKLLARENGRLMTDKVNEGDTIHIDNRHVAPVEITNGIIINLPQRMVFHFEDGRVDGTFPAAVGRPEKKWQTLTGKFKIVQLREDPTWRVPASIQDEMEAEGKEVVDEVEPGPDNPLGKFWIGLSLPVLGIHGTNRPLSIYSYRTHGCIRLHPDDIEALYDEVDLGESGEVVYLPLMLARLDDGRVFLESQRDIYRRGTGGIDAVRALAGANHISESIDWVKAEAVVNDMDGIARDISTAPVSSASIATGAAK